MSTTELATTSLDTNVGKTILQKIHKYTKNIQFCNTIAYVFALFNCFGAENLFFRDSVFLDSAISSGTGAVNRKLQNQEKQNREKINFRRQKN